MTRNLRRTALAWAGTTLLLALCLWPKGLLPRREQSPRAIPHADKLIHFGLFATFGLLWMRAGPPATSWRSRGLKVLTAGLLLAVGTEWGQGLPAINRDPDALDALADSLGVALAVGGSAARANGSPDESVEGEA